MEYHLFMVNSLIEQDYPSLSQIAALLADKSINTLFAVTENQTHNYEQIKTFLIGAEMGKLKGDSSNIVNLITEIYQVIQEKGYNHSL